MLQADVFEEQVLLTFGFLCFWIRHEEISDLAGIHVSLWRFFVEILHFFAFGLKVKIDLFRGLRKIVVVFGWLRRRLCIFLHVIWIDGHISIGVGVKTASPF